MENKRNGPSAKRSKRWIEESAFFSACPSTSCTGLHLRKLSTRSVGNEFQSSRTRYRGISRDSVPAGGRSRLGNYGRAAVRRQHCNRTVSQHAGYWGDSSG